MNATILASGEGSHIRLALIEGTELAEYTLWNPNAPDGVGDLYTGRVTARATALGGVFVDLGTNQTGFLPDSAGGKSLSEGGFTGLRVTRAPQGGKGPRLAVDHSVEPGQKPGLIAPGAGPIADFRALHPTAPIFADNYALLAQLRPKLQNIAHDTNCFAPYEDEIADLESPEITLPSGARATITPTPALTAIDIDAGAATAERTDKKSGQARLNRAIIPELARQIRLRNLGGAILIDFAGMRASARASLMPDLAEALARDPLKPRLLGISHLGLAEILRPRIRKPLHELLEKPR